MNITLYRTFSLRLKYSLPLVSERYFRRSHIQRRENNLNSENKDASETRPSNKDEHTWVGPPHPVSNLRLKVFPTSKDLTKEEVHFYEKSRETQEWNQQYWESHNKDFERSKKSFMEKMKKERKLDSLSPENMAFFYRDFLNKTYQKHASYNWKWYKRNLELLYLSALAQLSRIRKLLKKDIP